MVWHDTLVYEGVGLGLGPGPTGPGSPHSPPKSHAPPAYRAACNGRTGRRANPNIYAFGGTPKARRGQIPCGGGPFGDLSISLPFPGLNVAVGNRAARVSRACAETNNALVTSAKQLSRGVVGFKHKDPDPGGDKKHTHLLQREIVKKVLVGGGKCRLAGGDLQSFSSKAKILCKAQLSK